MNNRIIARILATALAATASISLAVTPLVTTPIVAMAETAKAAISVSNVEAGATVTAYQLVRGTYVSDGGAFTGYEITDLGKTTFSYNGEAAKSITLADLVQAVKSADGTTATPDNTALLAAWTAAVANKVQTDSTSGTTLTQGTTAAANGTYTYSTNVEAGLYLVLVTKTGTGEVYNPVLLAVNVTDANMATTDEQGNTVSPVEGNSVDLNTWFENGTTSAYMKKSTSNFDKNIVDVYEGNESGTKSSIKTDSNKDGKAKGDAFAIGDTVKFQIDGMTIPSYSDDYTSVQFKITDTLENTAFGNIADVKVYISDAVITSENADTVTYTEVAATETGVDGTITNYTLTDASGNAVNVDTTTKSIGTNNFKVAFSDSYIRSHALRGVKITYQSTLAMTADITTGATFQENVNHAKLEYSNNPANADDVKELKEDTYHYTFEIDATKVDDQQQNLAGAEFGLYTDAACTTAAKSLIKTTESPTGSVTDAFATSDANGKVAFLGLDEGVYYLKETKAPSGYVLSTAVYKIIIDSTCDPDTGILSTYTVKTYRGTVDNSGNYTVDTTVKDGNPVTDNSGNGVVSELTYTNTNPTVADDGTVTNNVTTSKNIPLTIANVKVQKLPFTGGEGRYAIYIGSAALAGLVVVLLIVRKRMSR